MLKANSSPPKIKNKYAKPNIVLRFKKTAELRNKQNKRITINSLLIKSDIIFLALTTKLQKAKIVKNKKVNSQSNTPLIKKIN